MTLKMTVVENDLEILERQFQRRYFFASLNKRLQKL